MTFESEIGDAKLLMQRTVEQSVAELFIVAKHEWTLDRIELADQYGEARCLCEHPIMEKCYLRNRLNGNVILVGNVCVQKFLGLQTNLIFDGLRRIHGDIDKAANEALTEFAYESHIVNDWEYSFLTETVRRRNLTCKQMAKRHQINAKIIERLRGA